MRPSPRGVLATALLLLVFVLMLGSVALAPSGGTVAAWWPAAGVSAGAVLLARGRRRRWAMVAGVWVVCFLANLLGGRGVAPALGYSVANTAECAVVVVLMTRFGGPGRSLRTMADFSRLLLASLAGALVSGGLGGLTAALLSRGDLLLTWRAVGAAHLAALLVILPLFLSRASAVARPVWELVVQWAALLVVSSVIFGLASGLPVAFVAIPVLVWGALRNSVRTTAVQLLALGVVVSLFTAHGTGPFAITAAGGRADPDEVSGLVQVFLAVCAFTVLPLAVTVQQARELLSRVTDSEELFRHGFADAMLGMFILRCEDDHPRAVELNDVAARLLGQGRRELLGGGDWLEHFLQPGREEVRAGLLSIIAGERRGWRGEVQLAGDASRWLELVLSPLRHDASDHMFTAQLVDATEQHAARQVLEAALLKERDLVRDLHRLNDSKSTFVSSVSHELRTPVTSVVGYTEMLMDGIGGEVNADQRDMLTRIRRNGQRLMVLIEDLLTASRLESGTSRLELSDLDLRACAREALEGLEPLLLDRDLAVELVLDPEPLMVLADAAQLERLLVNLLSNAVKFTPDGGSVTLTAGRAGRLATLAVADTGMGVPEDEQDQLFSRFFRSSTAQRRAIPGTGIGLSIVRAIASQHGGSVSAVSKEGVGSTFTLSLPLQGAVTPIPPALLPLAADLGHRTQPTTPPRHLDEGEL